jgi:hypothetical protein
VSNQISRYEKVLLCNMDEGGDNAAEEEVVAEQIDDVVVEATEE